jgi:hypothetical protein
LNDVFRIPIEAQWLLFEIRNSNLKNGTFWSAGLLIFSQKYFYVRYSAIPTLTLLSPIKSTMAVTSKTANGRAENPHPIIADVDPFFHFMDFTFTDEELNDGKAFFEVDFADAPTHSVDHPAISVTNLDALPSPTPLAQIINGQYDAPPTGSSTISGIHQPKIAAAAVVSADVTVSKSSYDDDHRTTTNTFRPEDVLSIRGQGSSKHCGNLKFRDLVASKKRAYDRNPCPDFRRALAEDIIAELLPGRFLKKTDTSQRFYHILDYNASVTKALFAIRDVKAPPSKRATITGKRKRKASATSRK